MYILDGAGGFQNVVNGYPILPGGFHAHILAVIFGQPCSAPPQIVGESGKAFALVGSNTVVIGRGNTSHCKGFVGIHLATDRISDKRF